MTSRTANGVTTAKDVLFVINSANHGAYSRHAVISKAHQEWVIDRVWLDKPVFVTFSPNTLIRQAEKSFRLSDYKLIIYWPSSYQYWKHRLGSAFFRRGSEFEQRCWAVAEEALFDGVEQRMLNSLSMSRLAANKGILFKRIAKLGLSMPHTIITNDVRSVGRAAKGYYIIKSIADTNDINARSKSFPARLRAHPSQSELSPLPLIVQEEIVAECEFRTYFFGGKVVTVRISREGLNEVDVRLRAGSFMPCSVIIHSQLRRMTSRLARHFRLGMFSADFVLDKDGGCRLLDVNPHGSWHWLEPEVVCRLDQEFANLISKKL